MEQHLDRIFTAIDGLKPKRGRDLWNTTPSTNS
jgi:hypothetical protein